MNFVFRKLALEQDTHSKGEGVWVLHSEACFWGLGLLKYFYYLLMNLFFSLFICSAESPLQVLTRARQSFYH